MSTPIPGDIPTLIDQYLTVRRVRGMAENTVKAYRADLLMLAAYVTRFDVTLAQLVSERMVNEWLDDGLLHHGWSKRTAARRLASVNAFYSWLCERELVKHHPSRRIRLKFRARQVVAPELPELKQVIAAIGTTDPLDLRDRAILLILLDCALRVSEVAGLDAAARATYAVAEDRARVYVRPKGGDDGDVEVVGMEPVTIAAVQAWRAVRNTMAPAEEPALFVNIHGRRLTRQTIYHLVRQRGAAVGLRGLHPHLFRHRRIGGVTEAAGLDAANALARHKYKSTTVNVYGAHAAEVQRAAIRTLAPLGEIACNG
jgi:site-specific recombinase XerC